MEFEDQSVNDLILNIVNGETDINSLTVLTRETLENDETTVTYGIIGASHYVVVTDKETGNVITEVFACVDLESAPDIKSYKAVDNKFLSHEVNMFKHEFIFSVLQSDSDLFNERFNQEIENGQSDTGSIFSFPKRENDLFDATTTINITLDEDRVIVESMHGYPNEEKLALTMSVITKKGR
jgi:hypothetical protein